jgi:flagellar protein FliS
MSSGATGAPLSRHSAILVSPGFPMNHAAPAQTYAPTSFARATTGMPPRRTLQGSAPYSAQAARYRDAELVGASAGQLVVMLYDKMLLTLRRARLACEAKQIELRCEQILSAGEMIGELRVSLDHAQGGAIAKQLDALYGFMLRELMEANRKQDARKIDGVIRVASELRDAFAQIVAQGARALPAAKSA